MTEIVFCANGQRLEIQTEPLVVAKSRNEYTATFTFSDDWKEITKKTAVFRRFSDGQSFTVDLDSNGKCKVPWEVLEPPRFHVSAFGGNLRTMTETYINVEKTGYDENAVQSGTVPQINPTPTDLKTENNKIYLMTGERKIGTGAKLPTEAFTLWNDITLEEDVLKITMKNTDSGEPLNIKKLFLLFTGANTNGHAMLTLHLSNTVIYQMLHNFGNAADETFTTWVYCEKIAPGVYHSFYPKTALKETNIQYIQGLLNAKADICGTIVCYGTEPASYQKDAKSWTFGTTTSTAKTKAGSRLLVWGVQDN